MTTLKNFLIKNRACLDGFEYAKDMTLKQFYHNCERGNWIIWLFSNTNPSNIKELVLTAAHCANACRHLLKDERSLKAIDAALNYESYSKEELDGIKDAAYASANDAWAVANDAAWAAHAAGYTAEAAHADRYAAEADRVARAAEAARYAAEAARYAAKTAANDTVRAASYADNWAANALGDKKLIANIVRKHLPLEIWNQEIINN